MTNLMKLFASLVLVFGLVATSSAASVLSIDDGFKVYQSDTDTDETTDGEEKKKVEGEEEEPDC